MQINKLIMHCILIYIFVFFSHYSEDSVDFYCEDESSKEGVQKSKKVTSPPSPTLSHRDMARPPHEDPEYQRQNGSYK